MILSDNRKVLLERRIFHNFPVFVYVVINGLADSFQHFRFQAPASTSKHTVIRLYMNIISTMFRFLSTSVDIAAQVYLIRSLITGKTRVAINSVCTVLGLNTDNTFVKQRNAGDDCCQ